MNNIWFMLLLQLILILLNAFFACAEIAVIGFNEAKLEKMEEDGNKKAKKLRRLTSNPAKFLATIQVAITLSGFLGSAFAADNFSSYIVKWVISWGVSIPENVIDSIAVISITLILSFVTLVFGELVPKRIAMQKGEKIALAMSSSICFISKLFAPLVALLTFSTNAVLRLFRIDPNDNEEEVSEDDIKLMVDASEHIDSEEKELIQNIFEFDDLTAGEIATHRTDVALLRLDESDDDWDRAIRTGRHTRYPICGESADDVVGILNTRDYFILDDRSRESVMKNAVKPAYFVPLSVKADVLFKNMKKERAPLAIVLDEYGGMHGVITMNDLVEQLIGDFSTDEHTEGEDPDIVQIGTDEEPRWLIKGDAMLSDVNDELKLNLSREDSDTFGGYIFSLLGLIPKDGETPTLETDGLIINVTAIKDHQVVSAEVKVLPKPEDGEE